MRYRFIQKEKAVYPLTVLCRCLQVARSGFYAFQKRRESVHTRKDRQLSVQVRAVYQAHRGRYGSPRVWAELKAKGIRLARSRVARLLRQAGLQARKRRGSIKTTNSRHGFPLAPNVVARQFRPEKPNQLWASDLTYIRTHRGCQYASIAYRQLLCAHKVERSMSRKGDCWDNAVVESFFSTLKTELELPPAWVTKAYAQQEIKDYIETYYNQQRRHSTLGYQSPVEYEQQVSCRKQATSLLCP